MGSATKASRRLRIIVCDTGPVLHLREAGILDILRAAGEVIVSAAVDVELGRLVAGWPRSRPRWLHVRRLQSRQRADPMVRQLERELGAGEVEAIVLARTLRADWLLTDDAEARAIAQLAGLEVHGSPGVLLWAAVSGRFPEGDAHAALDRLARSSLWISARVLEEARLALRKIYAE